MRLRHFLAMALLAFGVVSAQAGQVFINDLAEDGLTVFDNCGGACISNLIHVTNEHVQFEWNVSLPIAAGQGGSFYTRMMDPVTHDVSDLVLLGLNVGDTHVLVDFYSDGDAPGGLNSFFDFIWTSGVFNPTPDDWVIEDGTYQAVAHYLDVTPGNGFPTVDTLFVASEAGVPEPATSVLVGGGLLGIFALIRRTRR